MEEADNRGDLDSDFDDEDFDDDFDDDFEEEQVDEYEVEHQEIADGGLIEFGEDALPDAEFDDDDGATGPPLHGDVSGGYAVMPRAGNMK